MSGPIEKLHAIYDRINHWSGDRLDILRHSVVRFTELRGAEFAATLAYYALFSLFPLVLFLLAILSFVLENSDQAYAQTVRFIHNAIPISFSVISDNLKEVVDLRGQIGVIGAVGALWSASAFFSTLARSINRAWPQVKLRTLVQTRLFALAMIGALFLLLLLSLASTTFASLLPTMLTWFGFDQSLLESPLWVIMPRIISILLTFSLFIAIYRWVPNKVVHWRAVFWGAAFSAAAWDLAKFVFTIYLRSGLVRYEFVYGSLGTLVALMLWIYISNLITLFGSYLVASIDLHLEQTEPTPAALPTTHDTPRLEHPPAPSAPREPAANRSAKNHRASNHHQDVHNVRDSKGMRG